MSEAKRELLFLTDPMCSWCWGFSPVITHLRDTYGQDFPFRIIAGGLRAGNTRPMNGEVRETILHHWDEVNKLTGQPFTTEGALPENFIYDTEPSCRALVTVRNIAPDSVFEYLETLHRAFYEESQDITDGAVLRAQAERIGIDGELFEAAFDSNTLREETRNDFVEAVEFGVRGFPTVILVKDGDPRLLTIGYQSLDVLAPRMEQWLAED